MNRSMRRGFAAVAVVAGLVVSAPGAVQASTQCGLVVCVDAVAVAAWSCTTTDNIIPGHDLIECRGVANPTARGYSQQSIPGSLTWSGTTQFRQIYSFGDYSYPGPATPPTTCTWAGLGEDSCGGSGQEAVFATSGYIPWGSCLDTYFNFDLEVSATVTATASKTLPLGLPTIDSATATEGLTAALSGVSVTERCAFQ
ncbi:MAG TPA: hypothetical protein VGB52_04910 [Actinomycetota bacterium]